MRVWLVYFLFFFYSYSVLADELIIEPEMGRAPLLRSINQATSIQLVMYGLTDPTFIQAIIDAHNNGKNMQVLLQESPYKMSNENTSAITRMREHHIDFKFPNDRFKLTHQKTFIFDHSKALIMTFNLTKTSFKNQRNFALLIDDKAEVNEINAIYNADWNHTTHAVYADNLVWSPDNSREKISDLIHSANRSIEIYAESINDFKMIGELSQAAKKGIKVTILTNDETNNNKNKKFNYLKRSRVEIVTPSNYHIHAKVIIIDGVKALIGSINLTKASLENNRELAIITKDPHILHELNACFQQDLGTTTRRHHSKKHPVSRQFHWPIQKIIRLVTHTLPHHHKHHCKSHTR